MNIDKQKKYFEKKISPKIGKVNTQAENHCNVFSVFVFIFFFVRRFFLFLSSVFCFLFTSYERKMSFFFIYWEISLLSVNVFYVLFYVCLFVLFCFVCSFYWQEMSLFFVSVNLLTRHLSFFFFVFVFISFCYTVVHASFLFILYFNSF